MQKGRENNSIVRIVPDKLKMGIDYTKEMSIDDAYKLAEKLGLDLVCINETNFIYTITDENKWLYAEKKREKHKTKEQKTVKIKAGIAQNDLSRKLENILSFKAKGHPVKIEWTIPDRMRNEVNINAFKAFLTVLSSHYPVKIPEKIERKIILYI